MIRPLFAATAVFLALSGAILSAGPSFAQDRREIRRLCEADFRTHCPGVRPGGGRLLQCAREKADLFSPDCLAALETAAAKRAGRWN